MKRYALAQLILWKDRPNRKPLLLKGARQVGKTWLMKEFGRQCFKKAAYVSFFNNQTLKNIFDSDFSLQRLIMNLNLASGVEITPEDTLIIFDEIQECPRALEALKFFCENAPQYPVIAAGSLLGVAIHEGVSYPVGKVDELQLYPLHFREFLEAMGEALLVKALDAGDMIAWNDWRDRYLFWLRNYYYVGGMPEVVDFFRQRKDYQEVRRLQKSILNQYDGDFGKHIKGTALARIRLVWNSIPMQLAKENKKFFFGQVKKGGRLKDFEMAIEWLVDCGLLYKVSKVTKPAMPLKAYVDFTAFKLFMVDVGLLGALSDLDPMTILEGSSIFTEFKGALTEQYVLQQLVGDTEYTPYYFSEGTHFEVDFLVQKGRELVPIEVKAEDNLQAKSLKAYCDRFQPSYAVRTSTAGYRQQEWMVNLPLYAVGKV